MSGVSNSSFSAPPEAMMAQEKLDLEFRRRHKKKMDGIKSRDKSQMYLHTEESQPARLAWV